jgi:MIP family channel proteins
MATDWTPKQLAAEFMAMVLFVWVGTGSAVASAAFDGASTESGRLLTIAIAFGFGISVLAYGIGHISGGHINPAVTLAFVVLGEQSIVSGLMYWVAQFLGAIVGSFVLWGCTSGLTADCETDGSPIVCSASEIDGGGYGPPFGLGVNTVSKVSQGNAFFLEVVGTYILVITVLNAAVSIKSGAGNAAPIAIGWSVMLAHIVLVPFTGCGINPARSLGPMVVDSIGGLSSLAWSEGWWVYYTAPFVGSLLAASTYRFAFKECDAGAAPVKDVDGSDTGNVVPVKSAEATA